ncbi:YdeI/OmpD-associated family protein [Devosia rhodophyticola]|uniref:YdeI/OmpD-associated family protein n=1 Tax=Devosia rhodophyticola TaxID=3026423 RepID=A0ABY7Z0Y4_9HYPH|nr:YdeI/OmpD-associated family protein [Devosia rhodophyticola]WDR07271.1 YdeI/OmpD-associated family protein [Devosia rhodophyticola]
MAPVIPRPDRIRGFDNGSAFLDWLSRHHASETELWLKIAKKGSDTPSITYAEALDVALCWGWIDGIKKSFDETAFLQRFSPRRPKSIWSQKNRNHIARLKVEGRMTEHGQVHVDAAIKDGRWAAAYGSSADIEMPEDLLAAISTNPAAQPLFEQLDKTNRFALAFRIGNLKTAAGRARAIERFVDMLARGETLHPLPASKKS